MLKNSQNLKEEGIDIMLKNKKTFNVKEVAAYLGIGLNQAYATVRSEDFPSVRLGRRIVVPIELLDEWLREQSKKKI